MKHIHISRKVENRIAALKKAGKAGNILAQKTIRIIERLTTGDMPSFTEVVCNYTKNGEKRIKNCRKYDLGCGYRLITLERDRTVFIPLLGTHDECQRWLENNSRLKEVVAGKGKLFLISHRPRPQVSLTNADSVDTQPEAEDDVMLRISDRILRRIFCGLAGDARKPML